MENRSRILTAIVLISGLLVVAPAPAKKRKAEDPAPAGLIAGTVFQQTGFSLAGAKVTVIPAPEGGRSDKDSGETATTDARGEFAFRVPAGGVRYTVRVEADGWQPAEQVVVVELDQRLDLVFRLKPAPADGASR